jgi:hypothetical protein
MRTVDAIMLTIVAGCVLGIVGLAVSVVRFILE